MGSALHSAWLIANPKYLHNACEEGVCCFPGKGRELGRLGVTGTKVRVQARQGQCSPDCWSCGVGERLQGPEEKDPQQLI